MPHDDAIALFRRWYQAPIDKLRELPNGDGGFAALIIALPLYERLIKARLKLEGRAANDNATQAEINEDLSLTDDQRSKFWAIFRIGFMHQAMGQAGRTQWLVSHEFTDRPVFRHIGGRETICLDPWKFADRVVQEFLQRPELITVSESFPLAAILRLPIPERMDCVSEE